MRSEFRGALVVTVVLLVSGWTFSLAMAGEPAGPAPANTVKVLGPETVLRVFYGFKTPVFAAADGQLKVPLVGKEQKPLPEFETTPPPAGWTAPDFDDSDWFCTRGPAAPMAMGVPGGYNGAGTPEVDFSAPQNHLICARAKFLVEDPARVGGLAFGLNYVGGAVVYLNGREIARAHHPSPVPRGHGADDGTETLICPRRARERAPLPARFCRDGDRSRK